MMKKRQKPFSADKASPLCVSVKKKTILYYSAMFAIMAAAIFGGFFLINGRSLVWCYDGLSQHCMALAYYGKYLRTILRNIFIEHTFTIPMFDFSIGFGADIIATLHYYAIGDPLNLLSVFVKPEHTEFLYGFLIVLKMYLAGLFFSLFMLEKNQSFTAVGTGAVAYAFTGYSLLAGVRHPFFLIGMIYCPLILLGIDRILAGKKPYLYIISLALVILSNFYSAYMTCIFMLIYAALKYCIDFRKQGLKFFGATIGKFAAFTTISFLIPMVIFLPQIYNTLATDRLNTDNAVRLFYSPSYYTSFMNTLTDASAMNEWLVLGFGGITILSLLVCFVRAKKHKLIISSFLIGIVFCMFPFFGHMMNGFTYVTNRWSWILALIACAALVVALDELSELSPTEKKKLLFAVLVYSILVLIFANSRKEISLIMMIILFAGLGIAVFCPENIFSKTSIRRMLSGLVMLSVLFQGIYLYSPSENNYISEFMQIGQVDDYMIRNTSSNAIKEFDSSDDFWRYDNNNVLLCNDSIINNTKSTSFFFSISAPVVSRFLQEVGLNVSYEQQFNNMQERTILQYLTGAKYMVNSNSVLKGKYYQNTGFSAEFYNSLDFSSMSFVGIKGASVRKGNKKETFSVYSTEYALPLGYTYDTVMCRDDYEKLSVAEKQNVLLQTAVTDAETGLASASIREDDLMEFDILKNAQPSEGITIEDNKIIVKDSDAVLKITIPAACDSEIYVVAEGMHFENISPYDLLNEELEELLSKAENTENTAAKKLDILGKRKLRKNAFFYTDPRTISVFIGSENSLLNGSISYYTPENAFYSGNENFLVNLGYIAEEELVGELEPQQIILQFGEEGIYTFDRLTACNQLLANVIDDTEARKQNILENTVIADNAVSGTISLSEPKLLATQIPYSQGWSVTVDGEKSELINVNTMFCGVMLQEGNHTVEFHYTTPYAGVAVALSASGILLLLVVVLIYRKKKI